MPKIHILENHKIVRLAILGKDTHQSIIGDEQTFKGNI
jgi:hypothetical protein